MIYVCYVYYLYVRRIRIYVYLMLLLNYFIRAFSLFSVVYVFCFVLFCSVLFLWCLSHHDCSMLATCLCSLCITMVMQGMLMLVVLAACLYMCFCSCIFKCHPTKAEDLRRCHDSTLYHKVRTFFPLKHTISSYASKTICESTQSNRMISHRDRIIYKSINASSDTETQC